MTLHWKGSSLIASSAVVLCMSFAIASAQQEQPQVVAPNPEAPGQASLPANPVVKDTPGELYGKFMQLPVSRLLPGGISPNVNIKNPLQSGESATRGMRYFNAFNCVGCHAPNGGGGIGPSLSNRYFKFGGSPGQIYMSIVQGRPLGMPAWGTVLPDEVIWDLVSYIESISNAPSTEWGQTISHNYPKVEQVPAEFQTTPNPWAYTQPFMKGMQPPK